MFSSNDVRWGGQIKGFGWNFELDTFIAWCCDFANRVCVCVCEERYLFYAARSNGEVWIHE